MFPNPPASTLVLIWTHVALNPGSDSWVASKNGGSRIPTAYSNVPTTMALKKVPVISRILLQIQDEEMRELRHECHAAAERLAGLQEVRLSRAHRWLMQGI